MTVPERIIAGRYHAIYVVDESTPVAVTCCRDAETGDLVVVAEWILPDAATRARLNTTAEQLRGLHHPALVPLIRTHDDAAAWIAVCPSSTGHTFGAALRMRNTPFGEHEVAPQLTAVLGAVEAAASLSPAVRFGVPTDTDIVIQDDGSWVVLPFVFLRGTTQRSSAYRAPELLAGGIATGASDVYALSAIAFQATTGTLPVGAEQLAGGTRAVSPRTLAPHLSEMWESVVVRGLQEKPNNRYQHAHEMAAAIRMVAVLSTPNATAPTPAPRVTAAVEAESGIGRMLPGNVAAPEAGKPTAASAQSPLRLGCLAAVVATLVIVAVMLCVILLLVTPWSPFRSLYNGDFSFSFNSAATAPTALPGVSKAIVAATPTQIPLTASRNVVIDPTNVAQLTSTGVITNATFGPVAWAPDGSQLAVAVGNTITLHEQAQLGEILRLTGHLGDVTSLSWSPDSAYLASGASDDAVIHVYDATTGTEAFTLRGHDGWIRNVVFSPDGKYLASGSTDLSIRIWSVATRRTELTLTGHTDLIGGIVWSADGNTLFSAARDGSVRRWNLATGTQDTTFVYQTALNSAAGAGVHHWATGLVLTRDSDRVIVGATDGSVTVLDAQTGSTLQTLNAHKSWITIRGLALSADDKTLYSAGLDGLLTEWDVTTGTKKNQYNEHKLGIFGISLEPNGARLVSTSDQEGKLFVWSLADSKLSALRVGTGIPLELAYAPRNPNGPAGNEILAICGVNGLVKLHTTATAVHNYLSGSMTGTQSFAFIGPDRFALIDPQNGVDLYTPQSPTPVELTGVVGTPLAVASSPDGKQLVVAGVDGAQLWRTDSFGAPATLNTSLRNVTHVAYRADGALMALRSSGEKPGYEIWDMQSLTLVFHSDTDVYRVAFVADDAHVAILTRSNTIELRPYASGRAAQVLETSATDGYMALATFPANALIAAADTDGTVVVYSAAGAELARLPQADSITAMAVNPAGTELAIGLRDGTVTRYAIP